MLKSLKLLCPTTGLSHFSQEAGPSTQHNRDSQFSHDYHHLPGRHLQWQQATPPSMQQFIQQSIAPGDPHSYQLQPPTTHTASDGVIHSGGEHSWDILR